MSNASNVTGDLQIRHPEYWTLQLHVGGEQLQFTLHDVDQENSLVVGHIPLDLSSGNHLKAVENAIYDNPVLLSDFGKVRILTDSMHFALLPQELMADEELAGEAFKALYPGMKGDLGLCRLHSGQCGLAFELEAGMMSFVQRTFNMPPVFHRLHPLCEHFLRSDAQRDTACLHLNLNPGLIDVVVTRKGQLLLANTFEATTVDDTLFYALHAWQSCGLDAQRDQMLLTGSKALRDAVTPALRRYVSYVMPMIFPAAALRIGHDAVKAPLELILLALCE